MPKAKAYQNTTPCKDPEDERKRLNAIKAKERRDKDKAELLALKKKIEKLERKVKKQRILKIILKSHNIKNPVEDFDDEDSDSDMEIISGSETVSARYAFTYDLENFPSNLRF